MALGNQNSNTDYQIFIKIKDREFAQTEFSSLVFNIEMNKAPNGEVVLVNRGGEGVSLANSGDLMVIEFANVSDDSTEKHSNMMCVIDSIESIGGSNANYSVRIKFSAGNPSTLTKKSKAYTGLSNVVMEDIFDEFDAATLNSIGMVPLNDAIKFNDNMTWRCISENMWEQFNSIVNRSYKENDYLFWSWDDVDNALRINSLVNAKNLPSRYMMIYDDSALNESELVKLVQDNPLYTIWYYNQAKAINDIGAQREKLFPNMSLAVTDKNKQVVGNFRSKCFRETMNSMGDPTGDRVDKTGMGASTSVYGELNVVRHNPNNTHNMYAMAPTIRDSILAGFSKQMKITLHNNAGPAVGSKVTAIVMSGSYKTDGEDMVNKYMTDSYIIKGKHIVYTGLAPDAIGSSVPTSPKLNVVFDLISDNFNEDGIGVVKKEVEYFTGGANA